MSRMMMWWLWPLAGAVDVTRRPLCNAQGNDLPVAGYVSQNNLVLDEGCRYNLFESSNAAGCLKGNWVVIAGSSNTLLEFNNLVNFLAPDEFNHDRMGELIGISAAIDVLIEKGKVVRWQQIPNTVHACRQVDGSEAFLRRPQCRDLMQKLLDSAPSYNPEAVRITFVTAFFWYRSDLALEVVAADRKWQEAKMAFITQIGAWYYYCCQLKFSYCPRKELMPMDMYGSGMEAFKAETQRSLKLMEKFCHSGRVKLGCFVQTISWSDGLGEREVYADMNVHLVKAMEPLKSKTFRLVDFYRLGGSMPEEVHGGHGSILLNLWMWTAMFNAMCPADMAAEKVNPVFKGVMCSGTQLRWSNCPKYHHMCTHGGPACEKWECMNSVPCTLLASDPPNMGNTAGLCLDPVNVSGFLDKAPKPGCKRLWCRENAQWLLPAVMAPLALLLKLLFFQDQAKVAKVAVEAKEETKTQKAEQTEKAAKAEKAEKAEQSETEDKDDARTDSSRQPLLDPNVERKETQKETDNEHTQINVEKVTEVTPEAPPEKEILRPAAGQRYPLGLARFLASSHVVVGHLFARGVVPHAYFFGWGFTWVPWFFMLSGFVLYSAYLKYAKEETMTGYVLKRAATIYPLYAVSLVLAFILGKVKGNIYTEWPTLVAQSFLLQAWVPFFTENALQMHCWFLSCLVVYWFFFPPISKALKDITLSQTCLLMGIFFFLPWLLILLPLVMQEDIDWYKGHTFYENDTFLDIGVVMIKYNPVCYFHVFLVGMLLAKLRKLLDVHASANPHGCFSYRNRYNVALQFVAPLGYVAVLVIFSIPELNAPAWGYKLTARVSVLMPFQAMILFGLAGLPSLPLPLFSYAFSYLDFLENYSYSVYVFQFLLYALWPQAEVNLFYFLTFLYASAFIIHRCVQVPIQKWWVDNPRAQLAIPFLVAAAFLVACFYPQQHDLAPLPKVLHPQEGVVDVPLDLDGGEGAVINPSLLFKDDEVVVFARKHQRATRSFKGTYEGQAALIIEETWHSEILMGSAPLDLRSWGRTPFQLTLSPWEGLRTAQHAPWRDLCVTERWIPSNQTLMRLVVTGPEDPKVLEVHGSYAIAFDSQPVKEQGGANCHRNTKGALDSVAQMYLATGVQLAPARPHQAFRLSYGSFDVAEKNWIPFTYRGQLRFVYAPVPHVIVSAAQDGESEMLFSTTFHPLHQLKQDVPSLEIRGSAQAVRLGGTEGFPHPHYLALLHLFDRATGRYAHHAYRFQAEPPFMILQVSSRLPLTEAPARPKGVAFAFASGLAVYEGHVVVSYGTGDRQSRAQIIELDTLDAMFNCSSIEKP